MRCTVEDLVDRLGRTVAGLEEVRVAYLFGSQVTGRARPDSDFDVAVLTELDREEGNDEADGQFEPES